MIRVVIKDSSPFAGGHQGGVASGACASLLIWPMLSKRLRHNGSANKRSGGDPYRASNHLCDSSPNRGRIPDRLTPCAHGLRIRCPIATSSIALRTLPSPKKNRPPSDFSILIGPCVYGQAREQQVTAPRTIIIEAAQLRTTPAIARAPPSIGTCILTRDITDDPDSQILSLPFARAWTRAGAACPDLPGGTRGSRHEPALGVVARYPGFLVTEALELSGLKINPEGDVEPIQPTENRPLHPPRVPPGRDADHCQLRQARSRTAPDRAPGRPNAHSDEVLTPGYVLETLEMS